jgi:hypothetical protein
MTHEPAPLPGPAQPRFTYPWWIVLFLVGLDYFSSLAYLPSIAVAQVGPLAPIAAVGVVVVTLLAALPVYWYVVGRSPHGFGATGLLEQHLHGWGGKLLILVLLGFVATDFVITRTLSVSDASTHILGNPYWKEQSRAVAEDPESVRESLPEILKGRFFDFWNEQLLLTVGLTILSFGLYFFLVHGLTRGFLRIAIAVTGVYLALTAVIVVSGLAYLAAHPELVDAWRDDLSRPRAELPGMPSWLPEESVWLLLLVVGAHAFPALALGLSGFELSLASAPLVTGSPADTLDRPRGRIGNSRKLIVAAALLMSLFVIGSLVVVPLLVPTGAIVQGDHVEHRALAYLAHGGPIHGGAEASEVNPLFGPTFGTLYDLSTVLILLLAGASATLSLKDVVPHFLQRFGMELQWAHRLGVIVHLFNVVILLVTVAFQASVTAQQWAYATSVLVLLLGASLAALVDVRQRLRGVVRLLGQLPFLVIFLVFLGMAIVTAIQNRTGLGIGFAFVGVVFATAFASRWKRSTELRFQGFEFVDAATEARWKQVCELEFQVLVPHNRAHSTLAQKEAEIREHHRLTADVPIIFIEPAVGDPSDFFQSPRMQIVHEDGHEIIRVARCTSIAHVIAAVGLAFRDVGRPPEIHFAWSHEATLAATLKFVVFGQGNIPWLVHELLRKAEPREERRPRVVIG